MSTISAPSLCAAPVETPALESAVATARALRPSPLPVFSPEETTPLPVIRDAVTADDDAPDCEDCDNTGHPFAGYFGGVTRFHDGCSACGREGGE